VSARARRRGRRAQRRDPEGDEQEHELSIESLAAGGDAVAHLPDGRVVFVPFAAPGDRMRVRVVENHRRYARALPVSLVSAAASREMPRCEVFGRCGGCAWQHLRYEEQLAAKSRIVRDALIRLGGLEVPEISITPSKQPYGSRTRTRLLQRGREIGYRERRSHRLCAVEACPALAAPLERALERLSERLATDPAAPDASSEREWDLAMGSNGTVRVTPIPSAAGASTVVDEEIELVVGEERLQVSAGGFVQANGQLHEELATAVHEATFGGDRAKPGTVHGVVLELFSGSGFLSLGLARRAERLVAVGSNPTALRDLRANLLRAEICNVEVRGETVEEALAGFGGPLPDLVVLDPPRSGLAPGAAEDLAALGAARIVYLSCDPATLARDLAILIRDGSAAGGTGYALRSVRAFDLFPQTPHVEVLAVLERRSGEAQGSMSP